jgi:hypothetical protein
MLTLFLEGYIDIVLSCFLNVMAIWEEDTMEGMASYFATRDDFMCSTVTIVAFFMVIFAPFWITYNIK